MDNSVQCIRKLDAEKHKVEDLLAHSCSKTGFPKSLRIVFSEPSYISVFPY
jgi:hypothetical protein